MISIKRSAPCLEPSSCSEGGNSGNRNPLEFFSLLLKSALSLYIKNMSWSFFFRFRICKAALPISVDLSVCTDYRCTSVDWRSVRHRRFSLDETVTFHTIVSLYSYHIAVLSVEGLLFCVDPDVVSQSIAATQTRIMVHNVIKNSVGNFYLKSFLFGLPSHSDCIRICFVKNRTTSTIYCLSTRASSKPMSLSLLSKVYPVIVYS